MLREPRSGGVSATLLRADEGTLLSRVHRLERRRTEARGDSLLGSPSFLPAGQTGHAQRGRHRGRFQVRWYLECLHPSTRLHTEPRPFKRGVLATTGRADQVT